MRKNALIILMTVGIAGAMITGCQSSGTGSQPSGTGDEGKTETSAEQTTEVSEKEDDNLAKIREAYAKFNASPSREKKEVEETKYKRGVNEKRITIKIYDTDRQILYSDSVHEESGSENEEENYTTKIKDYY